MIKGYIAYTTPAFTTGVEAFINQVKNDVVAVRTAAVEDTLNARAAGNFSLCARDIVKDKLGIFCPF